MGRFQDLTGQIFGRWKVISYAGDRKWLCECQCEAKTIKKVATYSLKKGTSTSCGCERSLINSACKTTDLTNQRFGSWVALEYTGKSHWLCKCDCGVYRKVKAQSLKENKSRSCGHDTTGFKNLIGQQFGEWIVDYYAGNQKWHCICSCGSERDIESYNLTSGKSRSCGCSTGKTPYTREEIIKHINEFEVETGNLPYIYELALLLDRSINTVRLYIYKYDLYDHIKSNGMSKEEIEIRDIIYTADIHNREVLEGKEIDLYYNDRQTGIEFNGSYWHSEAKLGKEYHQNKAMLALNKGIRLFQIFGYEWDNQEYKNKLINYIKRDIELEEITIDNELINLDIVELDIARKFRDKYSIKYNKISDTNIYIGLYADNELIALAETEDRVEYVLVKEICYKYDIKIYNEDYILLKYIQDINKEIRMELDLAKEDILKFNKLGFKIHHIESPTYKILNSSNCIVTTDILKDTDYKIFDCGNIYLTK